MEVPSRAPVCRNTHSFMRCQWAGGRCFLTPTRQQVCEIVVVAPSFRLSSSKTVNIDDLACFPESWRAREQRSQALLLELETR